MKVFSSLLFIILFTFACKEKISLKETYEPIAYEPVAVVVRQKETTAVALPAKPAIYAVMATNKGNLILELFDKDAPFTVQNFIDLAQGEKEVDTPQGKKKIRFYDGLKFHRVIPNFMAQGGDPLGNGKGGPGYKFADEINAKSLGLDKVKAKDAPQCQNHAQNILFRELKITSQEDLNAKRELVEENWQKILELPAIEVLYRAGYRYNEKLNSHKAVKGSLAMANAGPATNGSQFFINQVDTPHLDGVHTVFGHLVDGQAVLDSIINSGNGNSAITRLSIIDKR